MASVHITCELCEGGGECPAPPYEFRKSWDQLFTEAPADLRRECRGWHHDRRLSRRNQPLRDNDDGVTGWTSRRGEEYWSAYYNFEL